MTWDLTSYFPQFDGPEMRSFKATLRADIAALKEQSGTLTELTDANSEAWEQVLLRNEEITRRMSHLSSYVGSLASSDARNETYLKEEAELTRRRAQATKLRIEFLPAVKSPTV